MEKKLSGHISVVTGAGNGIGRSAAIRLAQDGSDVAVWDINLQKAEETCNEIEKLGVRSIPVRVDVTKTDDINSAKEKTQGYLGEVNVLVNNAGIAAPGLLWETTDEEWEHVLSINLSGQFRCIRALLPDMIKHKYGSIVNVSSISALIGRQQASAAYSASKGGVISMTYLLAAQTGKYNIRSNAVCPGTILTGIHETFSEQQLQGLLSTILLQRPQKKINAGYSDDVANVINFLASPESSWITGVAIPVCGGQLFR